MSLYGGTIPAAGIVATLQSVGAAGLSVTSSLLFGAAGTAVGVKVAEKVSSQSDQE